MQIRRWQWTVMLLAGVPLGARASASCQRSELPDWAVKAILAYPRPSERPVMLVAALAEHYDTNAISAVDVDAILIQLAPSMLKAKSPDELRGNVERTMRLFHCEAPAPQIALAEAPDPPPPPAASRIVQTLPVSTEKPPALEGQPTNSLKTRAESAEADTRVDQLDTLARATNEALGELTTNVHAMQALNGRNCKDASSPTCLKTRTEQLNNGNLKSYKVIADANGVVTKSGAGGASAVHIKDDYAASQDFIKTSISLAEGRLPRNGLYVGPTYSLSSDGSWKSGGDFVARFESGAIDHSRWCFADWCRMGSEFSYRTIAALDKKTPTPETAVGAKVAADDATLNPFAESGGIFRYTGALQAHFDDTFGVMGLVGLTALNSENADGVRTRPRFGFGAHFQTLYGDGSLGQLFAGYVNDRIWDRPVPDDRADPEGSTHTQKNYHRWVIDGLFFIPGIDLGGFQLVARLTADSPINRRGPSDVRASLLLHKDLNGWLSGRAAQDKSD